MEQACSRRFEGKGRCHLWEEECFVCDSLVISLDSAGSTFRLAKLNYQRASLLWPHF
jgi:hypothetical protein